MPPSRDPSDYGSVLRAYYRNLPTKGKPTVDGAMRHIVWGGGRSQRTPLPIYKSRPRRSS